MRKTSISKVMSSDVLSVQRHQPLSEVWTNLRENGIHHVPVLDGAKPVGMISSSDILQLVYDVSSTDERMLKTILDHQFTIDDAMSAELITLPVTADVHDAAVLLSDGSFHSVLVIDARGQVAGIVTSTDLIRFLRDL